MVFPNLYYKRTAATAKACYICYKPTVTVLATIDTADFFYICPIHLMDRGFATRAPEPEPEPEHKKPSVSPEEIAKVKQEWEEKQRQKTQKKEEGQGDGDGKKGTEGAQKDAEGKDADAGAKADSKQEEKPATNAAVAPSVSPSEEPTPSKPTHERYVLHRDIFALRTADHRRRRQV
ncbi:VPS4-associated protein 1, partial [Tylopilus felleus]